jgi:hypothetical protein
VTNQDLERVLNPWMFDKSGNLKESVKEQLPDLAAVPEPVGTGATPCTVDGPALVADHSALKTAGDNATRLGDKMVADCQTPFVDTFFAAASAMSGWALGPAISTAHHVWENQFLSLGGTMITVGSTLHDTATGCTGTDHAVRDSIRAIQ